MSKNEIEDEELDDMLTSEPDHEAEINAADLDVSPDNVIDVVQKQRMAMLLSKSPLDKVELKLMDDMAKTSISQKRLDADADAANSDAALAAALAQVLLEGKNPNVVSETEAVTLPDNLPDTSSLDSQLDGFEFDDAEFGTDLEAIDLEEVMAAPALKTDR